MTKIFKPDEYITGEELFQDVMNYAESKASAMKNRLRLDRKTIGVNFNQKIYA